MTHILTIAGLIENISDLCVSIAEFGGMVAIGGLFLIFFIAFAIGEGLGINMSGKVD